MYRVINRGNLAEGDGLTYPQAPQQYPPAQAPAQEKFRGLAWAGLILGIVGVCGSILPIFNNLTAVAAFVGLILAVIAVFGTKKVVAAIGAALCVLAIVLTVVVQAVLVQQLDKTINGAGTGAPNPIDTEPAAQGASGTVRYEVTGSGDAMSLSYGAGSGRSEESSPELPWFKEQAASDGFDVYMLTVQNGSGGGDIKCRLTIDGEVVAENTSTGPFTFASCTGNSGL